MQQQTWKGVQQPDEKDERNKTLRRVEVSLLKALRGLFREVK